MKHVTIQTKAIDARARSIDCIASTDAIDSFGESLDQKSWDLSRYRTNSVVLLNHDSRDLPIGKAENVRVEGGALRARIVFADERANPRAEQVWQLVCAGMLNAVSVGFIPKKARSETRNGHDITVLSDLVLHEISVVSIPANDEAALVRMRSSAGRAEQHEPPPDLGDLALRQASTGERYVPRREDLTDLAALIMHSVDTDAGSE